MNLKQVVKDVQAGIHHTTMYLSQQIPITIRMWYVISDIYQKSNLFVTKYFRIYMQQDMISVHSDENEEDHQKDDEMEDEQQQKDENEDESDQNGGDYDEIIDQHGNATIDFSRLGKSKRTGGKRRKGGKRRTGRTRTRAQRGSGKRGRGKGGKSKGRKRKRSPPNKSSPCPLYTPNPPSFSCPPSFRMSPSSAPSRPHQHNMLQSATTNSKLPDIEMDFQFIPGYDHTTPIHPIVGAPQRKRARISTSSSNVCTEARG